MARAWRRSTTGSPRAWSAASARAVLLSDCVHNAGPDPRPFAARLPRLDVLLDTDVAPALGAIFTN